MTRPGRRIRLPRGYEPSTVDFGGADRVTAGQIRAAALVTVAHATGPDDARELLAMLGLLDLPRPHREVAVPAESAEPTGPLVNTGAAAEALRMLESTLNRFVDARIVRPARVDPDGARWWNLHDLRRQIASYLEERSEN